MWPWRPKSSKLLIILWGIGPLSHNPGLLHSLLPSEAKRRSEMFPKWTSCCSFRGTCSFARSLHCFVSLAPWRASYQTKLVEMYRVGLRRFASNCTNCKVVCCLLFVVCCLLFVAILAVSLYFFVFVAILAVSFVSKFTCGNFVKKY